MADRELEHPKTGHEERDVNAVAVTKFGIGLSITIIVVVFALWGLFHYFVSSDERSYDAGAQLPPQPENAAKQPPQPKLQQSPPIDLRDMRAAEDQILHQYAWV